LHCYNLTDYPTGRLNDLPVPFNRPDIAIVEECYCYPFCKMIDDLHYAKIPYVIIPRSTLTKQAQSHKRFKKMIGNILYFNRMIRRATAIQYLTEEERVESVGRWKKANYVISNGISMVNKPHGEFSKEGIRATYVGRVEIYQKGLDLLVDAIGVLQTELREAGFVLSLYGPNRDGAYETLQEQAKERGVTDLVTFNDSIFGEEKQNLLLNSDLFVMTSRFEGHPMGLIEALACGVPCVATLGTNIIDKIDEYKAGWTADNDLNSIIAALSKMLAERDFATKSQNARQLAELYSWDKIASGSHDMYVKLLSE
jgi:glycosyltransferase involved in cell wall biosynthesis